MLPKHHAPRIIHHPHELGTPAQRRATQSRFSTIQCLLYCLLMMTQEWLCSGFLASVARRRPGIVLLYGDKADNRNEVTTTTVETTTTGDQASSSFGNLLMNMQKSEQDLKAANNNNNVDLGAGAGTTTGKFAVSKEQVEVVELDRPPSSKQRTGSNSTLDEELLAVEKETEEMATTAKAAAAVVPASRPMDVEQARELDDSIVLLKQEDIANEESSLWRDVQVLEISPLYASMTAASTAASAAPPAALTATTTTQKQKPAKDVDATDSAALPLSRPEHYLDRIGRDRRHLAVSIAASTEEVSQWRLFCQEHGGLYPILETVREGARAISNSKSGSGNGGELEAVEAWTVGAGTALDTYQEETFHAACNACRAIRDLCAISPELAAVITDTILRANRAFGDGDSDGGHGINRKSLMDDFTSLLQYASEYTNRVDSAHMPRSKRFLLRFRNRRDTRLRCKLYVTQLLLAMTVASDDAVAAIRDTEGLSEAVLDCSSYARKEQTRRWLRYPGEMIKWLYRRSKKSSSNTKTSASPLRRPFLEAANLANDLNGQVQRSANQILAAIGYNKWMPKTPGQKGLRILSLDGGGSRGMAAITAIKCMMDAVGDGSDVSDSFDMIVGTSTGGIIAFLLGLQRETSAQAVARYQQLINKIFVKSALSTPLMLFTTATYDESHFMSILVNILKEDSMLDSRADPAVPLVCCLTSKMSSTPTHVALFRNYNYGKGELADPFTIDPAVARQELDLPLELEHELIRNSSYKRKTIAAAAPGVKTGSGSRYPGSFRVLQRYALRASTAAPTVFKPVMMGGEMYCDGGIVASNPAAVAVHEARALFPGIPVELLVSVGTGNFIEQKSAPRVGWDGIIGQIVNSACDGEQIHHILEDVLGTSAVLSDKDSAVGKTRYFRFNPVVGLPDEFPIDVTDPIKLAKLRKITTDYMAEPEQQAKVDRVSDILRSSSGRRRRIKRSLSSTP